MHGQLLAQGGQGSLVAGRFQRDENADLAQAGLDGVVDIAFDHAVADRDQLGATQIHVLADLGNGFAQFGGHAIARARIGHLAQLGDVAIGFESQIGNGADNGLELFVASNEVGFRVHFDNGSLGAGAGNTNQAFSGNAVGLLGGLGEATCAQPVDRCFHIAIGFGQGLLAVHHPDASRVAELLDHSCCDFHGFTSWRPHPRGRMVQVSTKFA